MITALHAENLKSLQDLHLDDLRRINLISAAAEWAIDLSLKSSFCTRSIFPETVLL